MNSRIKDIAADVQLGTHTCKDTKILVGGHITQNWSQIRHWCTRMDKKKEKKRRMAMRVIITNPGSIAITGHDKYVSFQVKLFVWKGRK